MILWVGLVVSFFQLHIFSCLFSVAYFQLPIFSYLFMVVWVMLVVLPRI